MSEAAPVQRYAIVVVLEASSAALAWEAASDAADALNGDGKPDCIYVGAPWQGIPAEAEDLATDHLELAMSVPGGRGRFTTLTAVLDPCG